MVKELERAGLPTCHVCSIVPISKTVGANRIVPSVAIPHPLGDPERRPDEELALREALLERAIEAIETSIDAQTVFEGGRTSTSFGINERMRALNGRSWG